MPPRTRKKPQASTPELEVVAHTETIIAPPPPEATHEMEHDAPPPVGVQLRKERERRGISVEAVAQMLKIRRVYLQAIEDSNWAELPEPVYVSGFIRSYANFLGLNVQHPIPAAKTEIVNLPSLPKLEIPKPIDDQQLPSATTLIVAALGLFFLYAIWTAIHSDNDKTAAQTPPAATTDATPTDQTAMEPAAPAATATPTVSSEPALVQSSDTADATKPATVEPTVYGASTPTRATISATEDSWIQIHGKDDQIIFSAILRNGDSYQVPEDPTLFLTTTNLRGLQFKLDGNPVTPAADAEDALTHGLSLAPTNFLKLEAPAPQTATAPTTTPTAAAPPKIKTVRRRAPVDDDEEDSISDTDAYPSNRNTNTNDFQYPSQRR